MEGKQKRESFRKKAGLLAHHLRPAASAFALGIGASLAATLLRTLFTQIIRFTVDHALLGETDGLPAFLLDAPAGRILVWCAAAAATVALLEFGAGFAAARLRGSENNDAFVLRGEHACTMRANGMEMEIWTDYPALQIYSGEGLTEPFAAGGGIALEPEVYPDSPHHADWPQATLRAGEKFQKYIEYRFRKV